MATENYGLPTFDGENATKPIQFKSTITQGFQKIDEVMKANETAAGPVGNLSTTVSNINNQVKTHETAIAALNNPTLTRIPITISSSAIMGSPNQPTNFDVVSNKYATYIKIMAVVNTIASGTVLATVQGRINDFFDNNFYYLCGVKSNDGGTNCKPCNIGFKVNSDGNTEISIAYPGASAYDVVALSACIPNGPFVTKDRVIDAPETYYNSITNNQ